MATIGEDIASMRADLRNISENFKDFKESNNEFCKSVTIRLDTVEDKALETSQRVSNLAIFQSVLSILIGAAATFLGVKRQ